MLQCFQKINIIWSNYKYLKTIWKARPVMTKRRPYLDFKVAGTPDVILAGRIIAWANAHFLVLGCHRITVQVHRSHGANCKQQSCKVMHRQSRKGMAWCCLWLTTSATLQFTAVRLLVALWTNALACVGINKSIIGTRHSGTCWHRWNISWWCCFSMRGCGWRRPSVLLCSWSSRCFSCCRISCCGWCWAGSWCGASGCCNWTVCK